MAKKGEVLVSILNKPLDFAIARERHWYRIPVRSVEKWLKDCWPPHWLAFYQTKIFGEEAFKINYFAEVSDTREVFRSELFPDEPQNPRNQWRYYQLILNPIQPLARPIYSQRRRRIIFIPTTKQKFTNAVEINDLYQESSLEDLLWAELKRWKIPAERQEFVKVNLHDYALDFAIYCATRNIDVETDGDVWHANPERAAQDNVRDNDLKTGGWEVLRFSSRQIQEEANEYCLQTIVKNINNFGGLEEGKAIPRKIDLDRPPGTYQLSLFDDL